MTQERPPSLYLDDLQSALEKGVKRHLFFEHSIGSNNAKELL